jgi:hypothetical protein
LGQIASTAPALDWTGYLSIWLSGWTWWLLIGPLLLVLLVFPTGRLLSPRWRWVVVLIAVVFASFLIIATASPMWQDPNSGQIVPNPLGVMPVDISFEAIQAPWSIGLLSAVGLCVISVLLRYRRAGAVEREQLKWFFYACGIFLAVYAPGFLIQSDAPDLFGVLFGFAILFIPVSIGIAILRYRLFDIDIIIRRTLIYSVLTAILAFLYLGSVIALQQLLRALTGAESELAIIVSTLAIVALFTPLRRRVQGTIDHRFYRRRYDATQVLAGFGTTARDEIELDRLTGELVSLVHETMQPATVSFWVRKGTSPTVK